MKTCYIKRLKRKVKVFKHREIDLFATYLELAKFELADLTKGRYRIPRDTPQNPLYFFRVRLKRNIEDLVPYSSILFVDSIRKVTTKDLKDRAEWLVWYWESHYRKKIRRPCHVLQVVFNDDYYFTSPQKYDYPCTVIESYYILLDE